jgi:hypothetical protein
MACVACADNVNDMRGKFTKAEVGVEIILVILFEYNHTLKKEKPRRGEVSFC